MYVDYSENLVTKYLFAATTVVYVGETAARVRQSTALATEEKKVQEGCSKKVSRELVVVFLSFFSF